jgi:hypothetical protein
MVNWKHTLCIRVYVRCARHFQTSRYACKLFYILDLGFLAVNVERNTIHVVLSHRNGQKQTQRVQSR